MHVRSLLGWRVESKDRLRTLTPILRFAHRSTLNPTLRTSLWTIRPAAVTIVPTSAPTPGAARAASRAGWPVPAVRRDRQARASRPRSGFCPHIPTARPSTARRTAARCSSRQRPSERANGARICTGMMSEEAVHHMTAADSGGGDQRVAEDTLDEVRAGQGGCENAYVLAQHGPERRGAGGARTVRDGDREGVVSSREGRDLHAEGRRTEGRRERPTGCAHCQIDGQGRACVIAVSVCAREPVRMARQRGSSSGLRAFGCSRGT